MKSIFKILVLFFGISCFSQQLIFENLFDSSLNSEIACYRIPAILTSTNGTLIAAIDERNNSCGDLKWNRNINIVIRKSYDDGKTWSETEKIIDYPDGESASDPSMILDQQTGHIFLFYNYMNLDLARDIYRLMVIKSSDNGKNWSVPKDITSQITKKDWDKDFMFITSGRGTQTKDGTLLHCLVNLNKGTHVFGSNDNGENWFLFDYPLKPGDESKIVELSNGDWLVNSRVNSNEFRYSHISKNKGKSWFSFENKDLSDPACNASLINYNTNSKSLLLFSNAFSSKERNNLSISKSYDQGISWENTKTIYKGKSAYSSMTLLKNGDIGLFFEKDDYTKNVFVRVPKKWILHN